MAVDTSSKKRTKRVKPCQRCKTLRRKCDRPSATEACLRCREMKRECVNEDGALEIEDDSIDGNFDLQQLAMEVSSLKESLRYMEQTLQEQRATATIDTELDPALLIPWADHDSTSDDTYSFHIKTDPRTSSLQLLSPASTLSSNASTYDSSKTQTMDDYQWDLTLVNGTLRLDSPIRTLKELLAYGNALQRYLSPFAGVFDNTSFIFEASQPQSLVPTVIQVASWIPASSSGLARKGSMINRYHSVLKRHHPAVLAAANNKEPPIYCIDELVHHYLTCFNPAFPMIHGPSFQAEYESVIRFDPTQHVLTMAMCASVSCSTCIHVSYDIYERRILGDYFYGRAIDLLSDSFDDPDRRLETVMVINILSQYQQMTLRMPEGRKWCTIAYMIIKDLQREYKSHPDWPVVGNDSDSTTSSTSSGPEKLVLSDLAPITTDRDLALFSRHYLMAIFNQKFCDLILDRNPIIKEVLDSPPILYLEDECELTRSFISILNKGLQLFTHPVILEFKEQAQRMHLGEKAKVTLELILRYDQIYKDWWKSLPPEFRLCDQDPGDISCRPLIESCKDPVKLVVYIMAVSQKAEGNLTLAKPSNQVAISEGGTYELVRAIQERAIKEAFDCTECMTVAFRNLEVNKLYCIFSSDILIALTDLLCMLAASSSVSVKERAKQNLLEALRELRQAKFMEGNLVPPGSSPLKLLDAPEMTPGFSASNALSRDIMDMYTDYSIPCFAFGYDILRKAALNS